MATTAQFPTMLISIEKAMSDLKIWSDLSPTKIHSNIFGILAKLSTNDDHQNEAKKSPFGPPALALNYLLSGCIQ